MTTRAAGYVRVSTERQAVEGLSLAEQERRIRAHCDAQGWELGRVYVDAGMSGRRADRPQLLELLAHVGEFERVVVVRLDRLGRSAAHLWRVYGELEAAGVALVSLSEGFDTGTPAGRLLRAVLSAVAELEADTISERVRAVTEARARRGDWHGGSIAFGYRVGEGGGLVVDQAEAEVVRRIFREYVAGSSQRAIAIGLVADGLPTRQGGPWRGCTIGSVLRNPIHCGRTRLHGEVYDGRHEPIVSAELWERAAARRASLQRTPGGGRGRLPTGSHLFVRGHLRCGRCGGAMMPRTERRVGAQPYEVYACSEHLRDSAACPRGPIRRELVDTAVYGYFESAGLDVEATRRALEDALAGRRSEARAQRERAERDVTELKGQLARVEADYLRGGLSAESHDRLGRRVREELQAAEAELAQFDRREAELDPEHVFDDLEEETLARLAAIRQAVAAGVAAGGALDGVRATLREMFESFTLVHVSDEWRPGIVYEELEFGRDFPALGAEWLLYPRVRETAVARWVEERPAHPDLGVEAVRLPVLERRALPLGNDYDGVTR